MRRIIFILLILICLPTACQMPQESVSPTQDHQATVRAEMTAISVQQAQAAAQTATAQPTATPTATSEPTIIPSPAPTETPFNGIVRVGLNQKGTMGNISITVTKVERDGYFVLVYAEVENRSTTPLNMEPGKFTMVSALGEVLDPVTSHASFYLPEETPIDITEKICIVFKVDDISGKVMRFKLTPFGETQVIITLDQ